jgi:AbiV family abortive infection protein
MGPKALKRLMQLPRQERPARIAEGLELLAAQVANLEEDLSLLAEAERWRGLDILSAQADEEAAKALILLDFVRMDPGDEEALARQLGRFSEHRARCIYVEMAEMSPADFAEVERLVDSMRASHYLDGPNDVDWIFRNQLLARREESLYVDYVHEEEGDRWVTPASNDVFLYPPTAARVRRLVGAFHRLGVMSVEGLTVVGDRWSPIMLQEQTHWQEVLPINRAVVEELIDRDLVTAQATSEDADLAIHHWPFPMGNLDLSQEKVDISELEAQRASWQPDY